MRSRIAKSLFTLAAVITAGPVAAAVLPDDRADVLYHSYSGDNVEVGGPSILVRKGFAKNFSAYGNYYTDSVSSASIDVITTASPYAEERNQYGLGLDALYNKTIFSFGYVNSFENDYTANSAYFNVSQDAFGGLTTITLGYSVGWDEVRRNGDPDFKENVDRQHYRIGFTQVLTKNALLNFAFETITDEGFLNNPYRSVRYVDPTSGTGYSFEPELYPNTRTSNAAALRSRYYLPYRASFFGEYRYYTDTWDINAHTVSVGYTHPIKRKWTLDLKYRYYTQNSAAFYSDLFPRPEATNFRARDKELSTFTSNSVGLGASYKFAESGWRFINHGTFNVYYDYFFFDYADFRNITEGGPPGTEPLFSFGASVLQLWISVWF